MKALYEWIGDNHNKLFVAFILGLIAVFLGVMISAANSADKRRDAREARADAYLVDHKCVTVSYAGKYAEPVYQCDNGLVMRKQIP